MRFSSRSDAPTSWVGFKDQGKGFFEQGHYEDALDSYESALKPEYECPNVDRQILLSNVVACRLKIGGPAQAQAAVESAKQCVSINPSWAKGHVRLASAYIALGGHSNDACNELQTALRLDPGNSLARQMLIRELRRDHADASRASSMNVDDEDEDATPFVVDPPENPNYVPAENPNYVPPAGQPQPRARPQQQQQAPIDDTLSLWERLQFYQMRVVSWYNNQSDDVKAGLKILLVLLVLYVAFGGRFGLEKVFEPKARGNYGAGNAYDQYYHGRNNGYENSYSYNYGGGHRRGSSFQMPDLFDGSLPSMIILMAIGYLCYRNGINPFRAMIILNMMGGGRRRRGRYGGMQGFGGGMGGFGGGMGMGMHGRRRRW